MAARKPVRNNSQSDGPKAIVVFWIIFAVVIISVFLFNAETIKKNFELFKTRITSTPGTEDELLEERAEENITEVTSVPEVIIIEPEPKPVQITQPQQQTNQSTSQNTTNKTQQPNTQSSNDTSVTPVPETRDRAVYFVHVSNDGQIIQTKVTRKLPVSQTPMQDVLNAILLGPNSDELKKDIINLIPHNTRLLSASVRGSTAYLNFSEDFMFNSFGVEGYIAQLRQIVWTVTEFSNVRDVQILIEGRRVDYLAEGIWIGSPIDREFLN